jgi:hypothetical protein
MDKILEKHLASALVLAKSDLNISIPDENIISYESCTLENNKYKIITEQDSFTSEIIGYWKDKPIISYNKSKYTILENSNTIVKLKNLNITDDKIKKEPEEVPKNIAPLFPDKNLVSKQIVRLKPKPETIAVKDPVVVKQEIPTPNPQNIAKQLDELLPKKETSANSNISSYVDTLKKSDEPKESKPEENVDTSNYIQSNKPKSLEDELFSLFDTKKDDPRFKRFFGYYSDQTKKEVHEINEKYSKQYMAKILETSGGGGTSNSAINYAYGGLIDGDLTITNNLSVLGNLYAQIDNKRVFNIGNNTDTDYVLDHNLNTKDLVITMYDSNDEIVLAGAKNINLNQTLVTFSEPPIDNIKIVIMR